eukprot:TRINITY_DN3316_c0_g1_i1.p1 TRINITY_DN3316_c0_g1~~TRINITY_DN3316_c0_g1_i1.p1  ORF type:complete len:385 (+),score=115.15 TRINITY_DN3316_c0_g1_i1:72-1226(+)
MADPSQLSTLLGGMGSIGSIPDLAGLDVSAALAQLGGGGAGGLNLSGLPNFGLGAAQGVMPDFAALSSLLDAPGGLGALTGLPPLPAEVELPEPQCLAPLGEKEMEIVKKAVEGGPARPDPTANLPDKRPETGAVYFVLKAPSLDALHLSVETGLWAVAPEIEAALTKAYHEHSYVGLIFTVRGTDAFIGYGYMAQIRGEGAGDGFRVSWGRIGTVAFALVPHIINELEGGKPVAEADDGERVSNDAGVALCNAVDAAAVPLAHKVGVTKYSRPKRNTKRVCFNVTGMDFGKYVLTAMTKRRQRLRAARQVQKDVAAKEKEREKEKEKEALPAAAPAAPAALAPLAVPVPDLTGSGDINTQIADLLKAPGAAELLASLGGALGN